MADDEENGLKDEIKGKIKLKLFDLFKTKWSLLNPDFSNTKAL